MLIERYFSPYLLTVKKLNNLIILISFKNLLNNSDTHFFLECQENTLCCFEGDYRHSGYKSFVMNTKKMRF